MKPSRPQSRSSVFIALALALCAGSATLMTGAQSGTECAAWAPGAKLGYVEGAALSNQVSPDSRSMSSDPNAQHCVQISNNDGHPYANIQGESGQVFRARAEQFHSTPPKASASTATAKPGHPRPANDCTAFGSTLAMLDREEEAENAPKPETKNPPSRSPAGTTTPDPVPVPTSLPSAPQNGPTAGGAGSATISPPAGGTVLNVNLPPPSQGGPNSQANNPILDTIESVAQVTNDEPGRVLTETAYAARQAVLKAAGDDQRALSNTYRNIPVEELGGYMQRAQNALSDTINVLSQAKGGLDPGENARFLNYHQNALDKSMLALDALKDDQERANSFGSQSPFAGFAGIADAHPLARSAALSEIFGAKMPTRNATTPDALVDRLLMFNGLPAPMQAAALANLRLAEQTRFTMPNGKTQTLAILHNGYIFGGGATALDCSSFVSSILPADARKGRFTTLDFRTIWMYRRNGKFPTQPQYTPTRAKEIRGVAEGFLAVDPALGENAKTGDLLVYRLLEETAGHIFIIRSYNPVTMVAEVIEAAQSAGTLREREFPLSADPLDAPQRFVKPGLMVLRLRPTNNGACSYKDHAKNPRGGAQ
jgi:hypothetical protein